MRRKKTSRAFTIIEMAVVLAVASIIAAVVLPDFIETARNDLADQTAVQLTELMSMARQFYHTEGLKVSDPFYARWPGESKGGTDGPDCRPGPIPSDTELITARLVRSGDLINPWRQSVFFSLQSATPGCSGFCCLFPSLPGCGGGGGGPQPISCRFIVSTDVPQQVSLALTAHLPAAACNPIGGGRGGRGRGGGSPCPTMGQSPQPGYRRCCIGSPRPSVEASLSRIEFEATTRMIP
ncbi:MAG: type II secretion system protein [Myxococcota bacterium]